MSDENTALDKVTFPPRIGSLQATLGPLTFQQILHLVGFGAPGALLGWLVVLAWPGNRWASLISFVLLAAFLGAGALFAFRQRHGIPLLRYLLLDYQFKRSPRTLTEPGQVRRFVPMEDLVNDVLVLPYDHYAAAVQVGGINLSLLSTSEQEEHVRAFFTWLNALDFPVQVISRPDTFDNLPFVEPLVDRMHEEQNPMLQEQIDGYSVFFDEVTRNTLDRRFYVVLPLALRSAAPHLFEVGASPQAKTKLAAAADLLSRRAGIVLDALQSVGLQGARLGGTDLVGVLRHYCRFGDSAKEMPSGNVSARDTIAPPRVAVYPDHLVVGAEFVRVYKVESYPASLPVGWLSFVYSAQSKIDCVMHVHPMSQEEAVATLRHEISRLQVAMLSKRQKGTTDISALEHQADLWEGIRSALLKQEEKLFFLGHYIAVRADSYAGMVSLSERVESLLRGMMVRVSIPWFRQVQAYRTIMPFGKDYLDTFSVSSGFFGSMLSPASSYLLPTSSLATMYPFSSSVLFQERGILYGLSEENGTPVIFDRYSMENYNTLVCGVSGSGKSYLAKLEALRLMALDGSLRVFLVDPLREFGDVTRSLGGSVLMVGPRQETYVNPLWIGEDPKDRARHALQFLDMLLELSREERALLDGTLSHLYCSQGEEFTLEDLSMELRKDSSDIAQRLEALLRPYTGQGTYSFLSKRTNVDLSARVVCFDLKDLDRDLFTPVMSLLLDLLVEACQADMNRKLVLVDEAWHLMGHEVSARALANFTRHSRHYHTGLTLISQTAADFLEKEEGRVALTNCSIVILARHRRVTPEMRETFGLTPSEVNFVRFARTGKETGYSTVLLISGVTHTPLRVVASEKEHEIITTNPEDLLARTGGDGPDIGEST